MRSAFNRLIAAAACLLLIAGPAIAQSESVRPPTPSDPGSPNKIALYAVAFILAALCILFAIMPSQRTHHD